MGAYIYLTEEDRVNMRLVKDLEVKEIFDEARQYDKSLMLTETIWPVKEGWFSKPKNVSRYSVYHECFQKDDKPSFEARLQISASGSKEMVIAYLYGIINGALSIQKNKSIKN